ncbi:MAG: DNA methyltransferase [Nitrososphaerota archaeon]
MSVVGVKPFWQTTDKTTVRLYHGDALAVLKRLPNRFVQCVITSPPYWALRDYGTGYWVGGDSDCDHEAPKTGGTSKGSTLVGTGNRDGFSGDGKYKRVCYKCGASRIDDQLGLEELHDCLGWASGRNCAEPGPAAWRSACYVCRMVLVFREVRRVLRDDGTLWLNLSDTYSGSGKGQNADGTHNTKAGDKQRSNRGATTGGIITSTRRNTNGLYTSTLLGGKVNNDKSVLPYANSGLPSGNLCGVPWRVAMALQADGWVLRQDIIWSKPSPMPESVKNRCTRSHEYIFLLTKKSRYYYDAEAIKEEGEQYTTKRIQKEASTGSDGDYSEAEYALIQNSVERDLHNNQKGSQVHHRKRNKRSVWRVSSQGYPGAHFATFPKTLIEPMILAGTSAKGCCADCGTPWVRITEENKLLRERPNEYVKRTGKGGTGNSCANTVAGVEVVTLGWRPNCECRGKLVKRYIEGEYVQIEIVEYHSSLPLDQHPNRPCVVLDPFIGSGTTCVAALDHGRSSLGIELSREYLSNNAIPRIEGVLLSTPTTISLVPNRARAKAVIIGDRLL